MCTKFSLLLFVLIAGGFLMQQTHGYCSLEKMKMFAMEACEHMFQREESRNRRAIDYTNSNHLNRLGFDKLHEKHHCLRRSTFPKDGYLKVNAKHFRMLTEATVWPPYKAKKLHHEKKERYKRNDQSSESYDNIVYCCLHRCDVDVFC